MARTEEDKRRDALEEVQTKAFDKKARAVHEKLLVMSCSRFTVGELKWLLALPVRMHRYAEQAYSQQEYTQLQKLHAVVELR
jgi:hypothetical protein